MSVEIRGVGRVRAQAAGVGGCRGRTGWR